MNNERPQLIYWAIGEAYYSWYYYWFPPIWRESRRVALRTPVYWTWVKEKEIVAMEQGYLFYAIYSISGPLTSALSIPV